MEAAATEVAVLGSGLAGLAAALTAREKGREVLVLTDAETHPATSLSGGTFRSSTPGYSPEQYFLDIVTFGGYLAHRPIARALAQEGPSGRAFLEAAGVKTADDKIGFRVGQGGPAPGRKLTQALTAAAEAAGVVFRSALGWDVILAPDGSVGGLLAYDPSKADWLLVSARSVILATGGAAGIYFRTDNSPGATGDGIAMAFRAGALLADMEFVQFWPVAALGTETCVLIGSGEVSGKRLVVGDKDVTDKVALAGWASGKADPARVARLIYEAAGTAILGPDEEFPIYLGETRVTPAAHHTMGGVVCGDHGQTRVPGLFAAGEVAAGGHGAARLTGSGLAEALAMGRRAGSLAAADPIYPTGRAEPLSDDELEREARDRITRVTALLDSRDPAALRPAQGRERVSRALWKSAALVRTRESLDATQSEINKVKRSLPLAVDLRNGAEVRAGLKTLNLLLVAEAVTRSARYRKESRGVHFRSDFPERDEAEWLRHVRVKLLCGEMSLAVSAGLDLMEP